VPVTNGDCIVDIGDLTKLIDYLFLTFTPLEVGCDGAVSGKAVAHPVVEFSTDLLS